MKFRAPHKHGDEHHSWGWSHGLGTCHPSLSVLTQAQCGSSASESGSYLENQDWLLPIALCALCLLVPMPLLPFITFLHLFVSILALSLWQEVLLGPCNLIWGGWVMSAVGSGTWRLVQNNKFLLHIPHPCLTTWHWTSVKGGLGLSW